LLLFDQIPEVTFGLGLTGVLAIFVFLFDDIENPLNRSAASRALVGLELGCKVVEEVRAHN
jgi:hypothetical protein